MDNPPVAGFSSRTAGVGSDRAIRGTPGVPGLDRGALERYEAQVARRRPFQGEFITREGNSAHVTSVSVRHTYKQQMLDAFPEASAGGTLRLEFFPESDHLFSGENARSRLRAVICDWLDTR